MRRLLFTLALLVLPVCAWAQARLPAELVGVWATEATVLRDGRWLVSGQALYLGDDGLGALVGGPPPIGIRVSATFDAAKGVLSVELLDQGKVVHRGQMAYDAAAKTLVDSTGQKTTYTRRSAVFDAEVKRGLGF